MKKFLIILALFLVGLAYMISQYYAYKDTQAKRQMWQETQDWVMEAEEKVIENESPKVSSPKKSIVVVPRKQLEEITANQQRLLKVVEGLQNRVK